MKWDHIQIKNPCFVFNELTEMIMNIGEEWIAKLNVVDLYILHVGLSLIKRTRCYGESSTLRLPFCLRLEVSFARIQN